MKDCPALDGADAGDETIELQEGNLYVLDAGDAAPPSEAVIEEAEEESSVTCESDTPALVERRTQEKEAFDGGRRTRQSAGLRISPGTRAVSRNGDDGGCRDVVGQSVNVCPCGVIRDSIGCEEVASNN